MKTYNYPIVTNAPMNTNITTVGLELYQAFGFSIQAEYTGSSISGTFSLNGSADPIDFTAGHATNPTVKNWTPILNSSYTVAAAGSYVWNVADSMYNFVQLVYTDASGGTSNGVLNARINVKAI